jgi:CO/xanthine dehydrogenase Mo-binding subunit
MTKHFSLSRRKLLKGSGALVVSFSFSGVVADALAQGAAATKPVALTEVDSFLAIDAKGMVTVYSGKVDLGTGVRIALMQIAAEELDVPINSVSLIEGDSALTPDQGKTWGSLTIQIGGMQLRNAAATARGALMEEAAKRLGAKPDELKVSNGVVSAGGKHVTYAELIGGKSFSLKLDHTKPAKSKDPKDFKIVGKPLPRREVAEIATATFTYMQDFRLPGMLHARVVRPPELGAKLQSVDENSIKDIPGAQVVKDGDFLAVVAESEWNAIRAARALKANWSKAETLPDPAKLWEHVRSTKAVKDDLTGNVGNPADAMAKPGIKKVSATYDFAINLHGSIGPSCAVADFKDGKLTSWSASQATHDLSKDLAAMLGIPPANVRCYYVAGAGCYGRNGHEDAAADAALISKTLGKPVRVQWSRADEHIWEPKGPPTLVDLRAAIDGNNVAAWDSEFFIPQQTAGRFHVPLIAQTLMGKSPQTDIAPGNVFQNSNIPYKFPNIKAVCHRLETTPFRPSWIRTPGRMQNTYANECFMDELAAATGTDPVDFRVKYIDPADKRGLEVLERLVALSKWQKRPSPQKNVSGNIVRGRGMSYVKYELVRTYIGVVADVEINRTTGVIRATKFHLVHDCGQVINPDGLKNQIEGSVVQTVSRTLIEELKFDRSRVLSVDWETYPILTFPQVPEVVIELIDRPTMPPWGAGEPSASVIPSSISNAVFDAIGVRLRSVPYTPDKVKAALKGAA